MGDQLTKVHVISWWSLDLSNGNWTDTTVKSCTKLTRRCSGTQIGAPETHDQKWWSRSPWNPGFKPIVNSAMSTSLGPFMGSLKRNRDGITSPSLLRSASIDMGVWLGLLVASLLVASSRQGICSRIPFVSHLELTALLGWIYYIYIYKYILFLPLLLLFYICIYTLYMFIDMIFCNSFCRCELFVHDHIAVQNAQIASLDRPQETKLLPVDTS